MMQRSAVALQVFHYLMGSYLMQISVNQRYLMLLPMFFYNEKKHLITMIAENGNRDYIDSDSVMRIFVREGV
nr:MAG TPA: hypothetical protein [Caudoviricetes sp.]